MNRPSELLICIVNEVARSLCGRTRFFCIISVILNRGSVKHVNKYASFKPEFAVVLPHESYYLLTVNSAASSVYTYKIVPGPHITLVTYMNIRTLVSILVQACREQGGSREARRNIGTNRRRVIGEFTLLLGSLGIPCPSKPEALLKYNILP